MEQMGKGGDEMRGGERVLGEEGGGEDPVESIGGDLGQGDGGGKEEEEEMDLDEEDGQLFAQRFYYALRGQPGDARWRLMLDLLADMTDANLGQLRELAPNITLESFVNFLQSCALNDGGAPSGIDGRDEGQGGGSEADPTTCDRMGADSVPEVDWNLTVLYPDSPPPYGIMEYVEWCPPIRPQTAEDTAQETPASPAAQEQDAMEGGGSSEKWRGSVASSEIMMEGAPNPPSIESSLATKGPECGGEGEWGPDEPNLRGSPVPTHKMGGAPTSSPSIPPTLVPEEKKKKGRKIIVVAEEDEEGEKELADLEVPVGALAKRKKVVKMKKTKVEKKGKRKPEKKVSSWQPKSASKPVTGPSSARVFAGRKRLRRERIVPRDELRSFSPGTTWSKKVPDGATIVKAKPPKKRDLPKEVIIKTVLKKAMKKRLQKGKEEKKLQCEYCGASFIGGNNALRRHQQTHCPNRQKGPLVLLQCSFPGCEAKRSRKDDLKRHEMEHEGKQIWECSYCFKHFISNNMMHNHIRRHHRNP